MNAARLIYRTRQFWQALGSQPTREDLLQAQALLTRPQMELFLRLQPSEQVHSLQVFRALQTREVSVQDVRHNRDLLVAALLHDAGKSRFSLHLWERVLIVLGRAFFPAYAARWGSAPADGSARPADEALVPLEGVPSGFRRAFLIAEQHPAWGAEMAAAAGVSPMAVTLIRRHQEKLPPTAAGKLSLEESLLHLLQAADDER